MKFFKSLFFILLVFVFSSVAYADNSFIFSTDQQSVPAGELSNKITIHSEVPVTETTYITVTSASGTGQFFSNTTSVEPIIPGSYVYISSGNSNRTVYYKDTTDGDFVLTANIFSKDKTQNLANITQHILIGQTTSNTSSNISTTTETAGTSQAQSSAVNSSSSNISAHSSPSPLSDASQEMEFEISAGRDRLTAVGNILTFHAVPTKLQNMSGQGITYEWSFGDGTTGQGSVTNHSYKFAGDYSVVVNGQFSDKQAVSRANIKVVLPNISLSRVLGGLEIDNKSNTEINLEGWSLVTAKKTFIFPKDTLIPSGRRVTFADDVTGLSSGNVQLLNPMARQFASVEDKVPQSTLSQSEQIATTSVSFLDIQTKINEIKNALAKISLPMREAVGTPTVSVGAVSTVSVPVIPQTVSTSTKNTATVFEATKQTGIISGIFSWPIRGFNFIKHLFVEN